MLLGHLIALISNAHQKMPELPALLDGANGLIPLLLGW